MPPAVNADLPGKPDEFIQNIKGIGSLGQYGGQQNQANNPPKKHLMSVEEPYQQ